MLTNEGPNGPFLPPNGHCRYASAPRPATPSTQHAQPIRRHTEQGVPGPRRALSSAGQSSRRLGHPREAKRLVPALPRLLADAPWPTGTADLRELGSAACGGQEEALSGRPNTRSNSQLKQKV
jgi:hypothetical protein